LVNFLGKSLSRLSFLGKSLIMRKNNNGFIVINSKNNLLSQTRNKIIAAELSFSVRNIFYSLVQLAKNNQCIVGMKKLIRKSGYVETTTRRGLKILEENGYIQIESSGVDEFGRNLPNKYYIIKSIAC